MNRRLLLIGGAGVLAVGAFVYFQNRNAANAASAGMQFPMVIGGASGGGPATGGASTDNSIAQMLAGQLSLAQLQANTQQAGFDTQKALAQMGYQSASDLANIDLAKTKTTAIGQVMSSLLGAGGGALNVVTPTLMSQSSSSRNSTDTGAWGSWGSMGQQQGSQSQQQSSSQSGAGYTHGSVYGNVGFDKSGNLQVNMTRDTASSVNPLS